MLLAVRGTRRWTLNPKVLHAGESDLKEEKERRTQILTEQAFQAVTDEYNHLLAAMADPAVREASGGVYSQPWRQ